MRKHTPGPWTFDGPPDNLIVWSSQENRICFMTSDGPAKANARLIAAAPQLLEVVQLMQGANWKFDDDVGMEIRRRALAAVQKATDPISETLPPASDVATAERRFCDFPKCDCSSGAFERCSHPPLPKVACPGADDPEERCPRHPSECACWTVDNDHPMRKTTTPQSDVRVNVRYPDGAKGTVSLLRAYAEEALKAKDDTRCNYLHFAADALEHFSASDQANLEYIANMRAALTDANFKLVELQDDLNQARRRVPPASDVATAEPIPAKLWAGYRKGMQVWQDQSADGGTEYVRADLAKPPSDNVELPAELLTRTFAIQHNPNCPAPWLVRMPGKSGVIDFKPYRDQLGIVQHQTGDILGFGKTLAEASSAALTASEGSTDE